MNFMQETMLAVQGQSSPVEVGENREMNIARSQSLMMYGVLGELEGSPMMDKGDRRKKKIEKEKGERPSKGQGSKAGSKSELDMVIFEQGSSVETTLDFSLISAELNDMSAVMQKKEHKKKEYKEQKNKGKEKQKEIIQKQG
jgi:hypothetical protein